MGYYTHFNLRLIDPMTLDPLPPGPQLDSFANIVRTHPHFTEAWHDDDGGKWDAQSGSFPYTAKWYSYHSDLHRLSIDIPGPIFRLHGQGEERGDEWVLYAYQGRIHRETRPAWEYPTITPELFNLETFTPLDTAPVDRANIYARSMAHHTTCAITGPTPAAIRKSNGRTCTCGAADAFARIITP